MSNAATAWPRPTSLRRTRLPIKPVPPNTSIFIAITLLVWPPDQGGVPCRAVRHWRSFPSILVALIVLVSVPAVRAQTSAAWPTAPGGDNLVRPAFWDDMPGATAADGSVRLDGEGAAEPVVSPSGPRLDATGDFRLVATVQATSPDLAVL